MATQDIIKSKKFKIAAGVIGIILFGLVSFAVGVKVGLHKARFSYNWGENYERNFIGHRPGPGMPGGMFGGMMGDFEGRDFRNAHGLAGAVVSVSDNNIIIKDRDGKENTISVTDKTIIKSRRDNLKVSDLKPDDQIVVIGKPSDNGVINADLIRVFGNNQ